MFSQSCLRVSVLHQNQFLCLAVLNGKLKVFYDLSDNLVELEPKEPESDFLRVSDADPKTVSLPHINHHSNKITLETMYIILS